GFGAPVEVGQNVGWMKAVRLVVDLARKPRHEGGVPVGVHRGMVVTRWRLRRLGRRQRTSSCHGGHAQPRLPEPPAVDRIAPQRGSHLAGPDPIGVPAAGLSLHACRSTIPVGSIRIAWYLASTNLF